MSYEVVQVVIKRRYVRSETVGELISLLSVATLERTSQWPELCGLYSLTTKSERALDGDGVFFVVVFCGICQIFRGIEEKLLRIQTKRRSTWRSVFRVPVVLVVQGSTRPTRPRPIRISSKVTEHLPSGFFTNELAPCFDVKISPGRRKTRRQRRLAMKWVNPCFLTILT